MPGGGAAQLFSDVIGGMPIKSPSVRIQKFALPRRGSQNGEPTALVRPKSPQNRTGRAQVTELPVLEENKDSPQSQPANTPSQSSAPATPSPRLMPRQPSGNEPASAKVSPTTRLLASPGKPGDRTSIICELTTALSELEQVRTTSLRQASGGAGTEDKTDTAAAADLSAAAAAVRPTGASNKADAALASSASHEAEAAEGDRPMAVRPKSVRESLAGYLGILTEFAESTSDL